MVVMKNYMKAFLLCVLCLATLAGGLWGSGIAQQAGTGYVPGLWRGDVQKPKPDFSGLPALRILTEADYPPFNYYDEEGALTGFNVELIQAICDVLEVRCTVAAKDWEALLPSLVRKEADIVAASVSISADSLKRVDFTDRYYETPARFVSRKGRDLRDISPEALKGRKVAVIAGTAHASYLETYYPTVNIITAKTREAMQKLLLEDKVDLFFDDGITSVFWLNGTASKGCCIFRGGPLVDPKYFGNGVGFAVQKGNRRLRELLNYALEKVRRDGIYEELFLRYFPLSFY